MSETLSLCEPLCLVLQHAAVSACLCTTLMFGKMLRLAEFWVFLIATHNTLPMLAHSQIYTYLKFQLGYS